MSNNSETRPYPIRMKENTINKLKQMVEDCNEGTTGDFVDVLLESYSVSKVTKSSSDIEELNQLTTRIYKLYLNMVDRSEVGISNMQSNFADQLEELNVKNVELKNKLKAEVDKNKELHSTLESTRKQNDEHRRELCKLQDHTEKSDKLIGKLEEDLVELNELKTENSNLRVQNEGYADELSSIKNKEKELMDIIDNLKADRDELLKSIDNLKLSHERELKDLQERNEFVYQQKELELKQELQKSLQEKDSEIVKIKNELFEEKQVQYERYNELLNVNRKQEKEIAELKAKLGKK